jgi:hypothetical protein
MERLVIFHLAPARRRNCHAALWSQHFVSLVFPDLAQRFLARVPLCQGPTIHGQVLAKGCGINRWRLDHDVRHGTWALGQRSALSFRHTFCAKDDGDCGHLAYACGVGSDTLRDFFRFADTQINQRNGTIFLYTLCNPLSAASAEFQLTAPFASQSRLDDIPDRGDGRPRTDYLYRFKGSPSRREQEATEPPGASYTFGSVSQ